MRPKTKVTVLTFLLCILFNGILVGGLFVAGRQTLQQALAGLEESPADPAAPPGQGATPAAGAEEILRRAGDLLPPVVLGGGAALTLLLWLTVQGVGRRAAAASPPRPKAAAPAAGPPPRAPERPASLETAEASPGPAVQILSILQREGRLIDFLQENLEAYDDAQIGAAVRSIHQGCRSALAEHVELAPVFEDAEGESVTVPEGFDARSVRLTGSVSGDPPFRGVLQHRGWRVRRIDLPKTTDRQKEDWILAPAEVEIGGAAR